jgi:uncharacterized protein
MLATQVRVSALIAYPIKSVRGIAFDTLELDGFGPVWDRRWMLIDENGLFVSQRSDPRLALVRIALEPDALRVSTTELPQGLRIPLVANGARVRVRQITDDEHEGVLVDPNADQWFSRLLGRTVRLVWFPNEPSRRIAPEFVPESSFGQRFTGFNDGFPLLLGNQASLEALNARLERPVTWERFRPNIVIEGAPAHAEDAWGKIQIGSLGLRIVKPCARCSIIMTNPETAVREPEPMRTLATYRTVEGKVLFAQNVIHLQPGTIRVGDLVSPG